MVCNGPSRYSWIGGAEKRGEKAKDQREKGDESINGLFLLLRSPLRHRCSSRSHWYLAQPTSVLLPSFRFPYTAVYPTPDDLDSPLDRGPALCFSLHSMLVPTESAGVLLLFFSLFGPTVLRSERGLRGGRGSYLCSLQGLLGHVRREEKAK